MKNNELNLVNSVIFLPLLFLVFFLTLPGCNQEETKKPVANQTQPTSQPSRFRYCTDRDLVELPKENEKLLKAILDDSDGWYIYAHIFKSQMNFYYDLPKAAKKLNEGFQIGLNCAEMLDCEMKDGSEDNRQKGGVLIETCREGYKIISNYISKLWMFTDSYFLITEIEKQCPDNIYKTLDGEGSARHPIQTLLLDGIPMIPTIEDPIQRTAFKNDLAKLCKVYQETDYCNRNLPEIHDLCETITK